MKFINLKEDKKESFIWGSISALLLMILLYGAYLGIKDITKEKLINTYEISYSINGEEKTYFAFEPEETDNQIKITTIDKDIIYLDLSNLDSQLNCKNIGAKTAKEIQELKD